MSERSISRVMQGVTLRGTYSVQDSTVSRISKSEAGRLRLRLWSKAVLAFHLPWASDNISIWLRPKNRLMFVT